ncbi:MAG: pyridoxamine 5-phosphate oxidase-related FMN-binding protein [Acidimicrobiales bacterium]|nr:pyridoxamine 5-phosphate oxidase-related FMN-binding protein [Acidimicrobiales bacterium]
MASWAQVMEAAPDLAERVRERFDAHGLAVMATIRADGAPRVTGVEPLFALDELWLGMMHGSRKAADLQRDPRLALHNATEDKQVTNGDAKIAGRAIEITEATDVEAFARAFHDATGYAPPPPYHLFKIDVSELSFLRPAGDHLVIELWREGEPVRRIERR